MISLFFCIVSSAAIVIIFRLLENYNIKLLLPIVINYVIASAFGFLLYKGEFSIQFIVQAEWFYPATAIGVLFMVMFYVIGLSAKKSGVAITSVASKMSVIVPVMFSILYYNERVTAAKVIGITLALIAVLLATYKKKSDAVDPRYIYLPLLLFVGAGIVDSTVKFAQQEFVNDNVLPLFSATLFAVSGISGVIFTLFSPVKFSGFAKPRVLLFGTMLGLANFGSIYFIIKALNFAPEDSSIIFGVNHAGVVVLSVLVAITVFKERITCINWIGIGLSVVAIWLLMAIQ